MNKAAQEKKRERLAQSLKSSQKTGLGRKKNMYWGIDEKKKFFYFIVNEN